MSAITGKCIVEISPGVWLASWRGDPGRTLVRESARVFADWQEAERHIEYARHYRPFRDAKIIPVDKETDLYVGWTCQVCKREISSKGFAQYQHGQKHVREGKAYCKIVDYGIRIIDSRYRFYVKNEAQQKSDAE